MMAMTLKPYVVCSLYKLQAAILHIQKILNFRRKKVRRKGTNHFQDLIVNWRILKWLEDNIKMIKDCSNFPQNLDNKRDLIRMVINIRTNQQTATKQPSNQPASRSTNQIKSTKPTNPHNDPTKATDQSTNPHKDPTNQPTHITTRPINQPT